jgi:hypothetical protein
LFATISVSVDALNILDILPASKPLSIDAGIALICGLLSMRFFWELARMRGSTVSIRNGQICIREWYGRDWELIHTDKPQVGTGMVFFLPILGAQKVPIGPTRCFHILSSNHKAYVNCDTTGCTQSDLSELFESQAIEPGV